MSWNFVHHCLDTLGTRDTPFDPSACGEGDMLLQWHAEYAALIPEAEARVIPSVTARPDEAAAALLRFLDA